MTSRRTVLQTAAGLALAGALPARATPGPGTGKPGEFDWLTGEWKIHHRQRKADGTWIEFEGEATCWGILKGIAHVEELRIPARDFSGMGLRLLDQETRVWSDFWVNARQGQLGTAGLTGGFVGGEGIFESADETDRTKLYRGVWDRIVPGKSHRWYQAASGDGGKSWDISWTMDWTRA